MGPRTALAAPSLSQPTSAAISGAIDLAARGALPAGYPTLDGLSSIPPVLLKAIAWVESGWEQFRAPDQPLISQGGGYGLMQLTNGFGGESVSSAVQSAIANNFVYNIAAGARLLALKWEGTPHIGDGDPTVLENWYYAVWAYNGWGWVNNPNNPIFSRKGSPVTQPWTYPYQERVFYYVSHPPLGPDGQPLWAAVPVTLPDRTAIGRQPGPLSAPASPHRDLPTTDGALQLPVTDAADLRMDLTLPDGSAVAPGRALLKGWLVRNAGGLFWQDYTWRFVGGAQMGAPPSVTVPYAPPLADVPITVPIVAPSQPGAYKGYWQLYNAAGQPVGTPAWVAITVSDSAPKDVPETSVGGTVTPQLPTSAPDVPTATPNAVNTIAAAVNNSGFIADVTIPDGTTVAPGQTFVKTWEVINTGTTTWDNRYSWHFEAGAPLGVVHQVTSPLVHPGATVQFYVRMRAPTKPGLYRGWWQMTDPSGNVFGTQAWVSIRVPGPATATPTPRPTATATPRPTSTPSPTYTPTHSPTPTHTPLPTATPRPTNTPRPTPTPRPVPQPWFGPSQDHAFFAEGYTGLGYHQYLSLLNPTTKTLRTQVTIYRANGATRLVPLRLAPLTRRTLDVNAIAPRMSTALRVEADGPVVAERAQYHGNGQIVGGAALPSTHWYVAEGYVGGGFVDGLRLFNPNDVPARITIAAYGSHGSKRLSHRVVPATTRLNVSLDDVAPPGGTALEVQGSVPIVVESVVRAGDSSGPSGAMAVSTPSRLWYFPDGSTAHGSKEYISILNPNGVTTVVHFHAVTAEGYQPALTIHVRPHARAVFVVQGLIHRPKMAAIVGADHPIVAQEVRYTPSGALSVVNGAPYAVSAWAFAEGYVGAGFNEWLSFLNPSMCLAHISVRLVGRNGVVRTVTLSVRARHRTYIYVNGLMPSGPSAAIIHADYPIVAGRTLSFNAGRGLSTTIGVALSAG